MPFVHEHRSAFDDRNLFLQVLMGMSAYAVRYQTLLARLGRAQAPVAPRPVDPFLDGCLGLAHFASHVLDRLHAVARADGAPQASAPAADTAPRRLLV